MFSNLFSIFQSDTGGKTARASERVYCDNHAETRAERECNKCDTAFCSDCIIREETRGPGRVTRRYVYVCPRCNGPCFPLWWNLPGPDEQPSFWAQFPAVFLYPLRGRGIYILITGTIWLCFIDVFVLMGTTWPMIGFILTWFIIFVFGAYVFLYLLKVMRRTAFGADETPPWPEPDWLYSIVQPFFRLLVCLGVSLAPAYIAYYRITSYGDPEWLLYLIVPVLLVLGLVYVPMAVLAVELHRSSFAVLPWVVLPAIWNARGPYFVILMLLVGSGALFTVLHVYSLGPMIWLSPIKYLLFLYWFIVLMRLAGMLFRTHRSEFGWFS